MKIILYLSILISFQVWGEMRVTKSNQTVYLIPEFRLDLGLIKINEGDIFGALNIRFQIDRKKMEEEIEQANQLYPNYKKVFTMPRSQKTWEIPLIGKIELKESMDGPYFIEQRFLDFKQFNEMKNYSFSNLEFTTSNGMTEDQLKETWPIPRFKCQELFHSGSTIAHVASEYQKLLQSDWMNSIKYEETKFLVKTYIMEACVLPFEKPIKSFKKLFEVEMRQAPGIQDYVVNFLESTEIIKKIHHQVPVFLEVK